MVNTGLLNQHFSQNYNSCVMASYAIVSNYYNNAVNITDVFDEYCNHFNIPWVTHLESELHCSNHINFICPYILHWRGYQMVDYLHKHSNRNIFIRNRALFTSQVISINPLTQIEYTDLITRLRNNVALANILTIVNGGNHSRTFGIDQNTNSTFIHDTALNANPRIANNVNFPFQDIRECIIYERV